MIAESHGLDYEVCEAGKKEWHILFSKDKDMDLKSIMKRYCSV